MSKNENIPEDAPSQEPIEHGECCEECKKTCKRQFWTEVLRTLVKVGTAVLAAFGIASCIGEEGDPL